MIMGRGVPSNTDRVLPHQHRRARHHPRARRTPGKVSKVRGSKWKAEVVLAHAWSEHLSGPQLPWGFLNGTWASPPVQRAARPIHPQR